MKVGRWGMNGWNRGIGLGKREVSVYISIVMEAEILKIERKEKNYNASKSKAVRNLILYLFYNMLLFKNMKTYVQSC